jgi:hypothetical protein
MSFLYRPEETLSTELSCRVNQDRHGIIVHRLHAANVPNLAGITDIDATTADADRATGCRYEEPGDVADNRIELTSGDGSSCNSTYGGVEAAR